MKGGKLTSLGYMPHSWREQSTRQLWVGIALWIAIAAMLAAMVVMAARHWHDAKFWDA